MMMDKPQSFLSERVKDLLLTVIRSEREKALKEGDEEYLVELQNAAKLIQRGCWRVKRANPYTLFMSECVKEKKANGSLKSVQEAFKECAMEWKKLPEEKKIEYKTLAGQLEVRDFV